VFLCLNFDRRIPNICIRIFLLGFVLKIDNNIMNNNQHWEILSGTSALRIEVLLSSSDVAQIKNE